MIRQSMFALGAALALAAPAPAQEEPGLPPLVPLTLPRASKNSNQRKPAEAKQAPPPAVVPELPLPPLLPPTLAVLVQNEGLPAPAAAQVEQGLNGVAAIAPSVRAGPALPEAAQQCTDDDCLASAAAARKIDRLLVATLANGGITVRLFDVARKKQLAGEHDALSSVDEAASRAEALACKLLVPAGCTGTVAVDAGPGVQLELDGAPLSGQAAVGVHRLAARAGGQETGRALPVSREGAPELHARLVDGRPLLLTSAELGALEQSKPKEAPRAAVATAPAPRERSWTKPAGIAALALGGAAVVTGAILGAKSRSDLSQAESAFRQNGGVYRAPDLDALSSGNSAAHRANALFVASAVLLAAGATLTFAF